MQLGETRREAGVHDGQQGIECRSGIAEEVRGRLGEFTPTVTYLVGTHKLHSRIPKIVQGEMVGGAEILGTTARERDAEVYNSFKRCCKAP